MFRKFALPLFAAAIITAATAHAAHAQPVVQCVIAGSMTMMPTQMCRAYCYNETGRFPTCVSAFLGGGCACPRIGSKRRNSQKLRMRY
jgi:hypothetical protein